MVLCIAPSGLPGGVFACKKTGTGSCPQVPAIQRDHFVEFVCFRFRQAFRNAEGGGVQGGFHQVGGGDLQHIAQRGQGVDAGGAGAPLDVPQKRGGNVQQFCQALLGEPAGFAQGADFAAHVPVVHVIAS